MLALCINRAATILIFRWSSSVLVFPSGSGLGSSNLDGHIVSTSYQLSMYTHCQYWKIVCVCIHILSSWTKTPGLKPRNSVFELDCSSIELTLHYANCSLHSYFICNGSNKLFPGNYSLGEPIRQARMEKVEKID